MRQAARALHVAYIHLLARLSSSSMQALAGGIIAQSFLTLIWAMLCYLRRPVDTPCSSSAGRRSLILQDFCSKTATVSFRRPLPRTAHKQCSMKHPSLYPLEAMPSPRVDEDEAAASGRAGGRDNQLRLILSAYTDGLRNPTCQNSKHVKHNGETISHV